MQLQAPIFPEGTKIINGSTGFFMKDSYVYYLHNGNPIFCHKQEDRNSYRYIMANLIKTGLCQAGEISKALGVPHRNINRYYKQYLKKGPESFFNAREDRRGICYQMNDVKMQKAQEFLDAGYSNVKAAKEVGISESAIRYHLKNGNLKKK